MNKKRFMMFRDFILVASSGVIAPLLTRSILGKIEFLMVLSVYMAVFAMLAGLWEITAYIVARIRGRDRKLNGELLKGYLIVLITASVFAAIYYLVGGQTKQKIITYLGCIILVGCLYWLIKKVVKLLTKKNDIDKNEETN